MEKMNNLSNSEYSELLKIASKYFGESTLESDIFLQINHEMEFSDFLREMNDYFGTSIAVEKIKDLKYLYQCYPLKKVFDLFQEKQAESLDNELKRLKDEETHIDKQFNTAVDSIAEYKVEYHNSGKYLNEVSQINDTDIEQKIVKAIDGAKEAVQLSKEAKEIKVGIVSGKKVAIETLQIAVEKLAEAGETQISVMIAQMLYIQRLAVITKDLYELSVNSTHATRCLIAKIENRLNDPNANLDNLERGEFSKLLFELKQREDVYSRLDKQKEGLMNHDTILIQHGKDIEEIRKKLAQIEKNNQEL